MNPSDDCAPEELAPSRREFLQHAVLLSGSALIAPGQPSLPMPETAPDLFETFALTRLINARGTYTPVGVSRSSPAVQQWAAAALGVHVLIDELLEHVDVALQSLSGAPRGTVTHCAAAGITLAVAACLTGSDRDAIAALPLMHGTKRQVVIPAGHVVDYGHSILSAIRMAGGEPVVVGNDHRLNVDALARAVSEPTVAALLLVESRLARGPRIDLAAAVSEARHHGVPTILDAAAQDLRLRELVAHTGADLVVCSAQKYLAAPTAGLVVGRADLIDAVRAQDHGIGRAMKPTKEAIVGVLAALRERRALDARVWAAAQAARLAHVERGLATLSAVSVARADDPTGLPFARLGVTPSEAHPLSAPGALARALREGTPPIWVFDEGRHIALDLVDLTPAELDTIVARLRALLA
jgi:uncharacterized pyridoxal phosphate-dependent enzyme